MAQKSNNEVRRFRSFRADGSPPELPTSLSGVKKVFENIEQQTVGTVNKKNYFQQMVDTLKDLQKKVSAAEHSLFNQGGPFAGLKEDTYSGLKALQARLDKANLNKGFLMMNNNGTIFESDGNIRHIDRLRKAVQKDYAKARMELVLDDQLTESIEKSNGNIQAAIEGIIDRANVTANRKATYNKAAAKELFAQCTLTYSPDQGAVIITNHNGGMLPKDFFSKWKDKLQSDYKFYLQREAFKFNAITEVLKKLIGAGSDIWPYVEYHLTNNYDKFDVNASTPSIIGFLGEVKANALIDYLVGVKGSSIPTGNIRYRASGQEIPVDIVFNSLGFQVKNFMINAKTNTFAFSRSSDKKMQMGNFLQSRLGLSLSEGIGLALLTFFGSYQFNQPIDKAEDAYRLEDYRSLYQKFRKEYIGPNAEADSLIHNVFDSRLDRLLRIEFPVQETTNDFYNALQIQFNTIFIIRDKIVPASALLEALILNLENIIYHQEHYLKTAYSISRASSDGPRWQAPISQEIADKNGAVSRLEAANYITVSYRIEFNMGDILNIIDKQYP